MAICMARGGKGYMACGGKTLVGADHVSCVVN